MDGAVLWLAARGNYQKKILALLQLGKIHTHGALDIDVRHDEGCPLLDDAGDCACNPEIWAEGRLLSLEPEA